MKQKYFIGSLVFFLLITEETTAQADWANIDLASVDAKILSRHSPADRGHTAPVTSRIFETDAGKIRLYLPPLSQGVTVSGTVYLEPKGRNERETGRNLLALQSYQLLLNNVNLPLQNGSFSTSIAGSGGQATTRLQLNSSGGQILNQEELPLNPLPASTRIFTLPPYTITGQATGIPGNFDGNSSNTKISVGGSAVTIIAESPAAVYFTPPPSTTGRQTITVTENAVSNQGATHILDIQMQAGKTNLRKGQLTTLMLQVSGLEGLKESVPVILENLSPSVIALEGGNRQTIIVHPDTVSNGGVYTFTRNIQSTSSGGFSVTAAIQPPAGASRR